MEGVKPVSIPVFHMQLTSRGQQRATIVSLLASDDRAQSSVCLPACLSVCLLQCHCHVNQYHVCLSSSGTHDIHALILGRAITGLQSFTVGN